MPRHAHKSQVQEAIQTVDGTLVGTDGVDAFVLRAGDGDVVVSGFVGSAGDYIMFDFGTYSDYMIFGRLWDGRTWENFLGTAVFSVSASDVDGDGLTDTTISVNGDSITLLGLSPEQVSGWSLHGG